MNLKNLIPNVDIVNEMATEEVAKAILQILNARADEAEARPGSRRTMFSMRNFCNDEAAIYSEAGQARCADALATAWMHLMVVGMLSPDPSNLNTGWAFITPRARSIKSDDAYDHLKKASMYPRGSIHHKIQEETYAEFLRGDYETAVFKAYKAIEVAVRTACNMDANVLGVELMTRAFNERGPLADSSEVASERDSLMLLFRGAIGRFKNPASHRTVDLRDPAEAIEIIQLASLLLRIVDRRAAVPLGPKASS